MTTEPHPMIYTLGPVLDATTRHGLVPAIVTLFWDHEIRLVPRPLPTWNQAETIFRELGAGPPERITVTDDSQPSTCRAAGPIPTLGLHTLTIACQP